MSLSGYTGLLAGETGSSTASVRALLAPLQAASCRLAFALARHPRLGNESSVAEGELCDDILATICQDSRVLSAPFEWMTTTAASKDVRYEFSPCKTEHRVVNVGVQGAERNRNGHDCVMVCSSTIFGDLGLAAMSFVEVDVLAKGTEMWIGVGSLKLLLADTHPFHSMRHKTGKACITYHCSFQSSASLWCCGKQKYAGAPAYRAGDCVGVLVDRRTNVVLFYKNGVAVASAPLKACSSAAATFSDLKTPDLSLCNDLCVVAVLDAGCDALLLRRGRVSAKHMHDIMVAKPEQQARRQRGVADFELDDY